MKAMEICRGGFIEKNDRIVEAKEEGYNSFRLEKKYNSAFKKKDQEKMGNYKGILLLCTAEVSTQRF